MLFGGDTIILIFSVIALLYGLIVTGRKNTALYFKLVLGAVGCNALGYFYDVCELLTTNDLSEGFTISYLGSIGCFLFLLTANLGYLDGVIDDRTNKMKASRFLALLAPLGVALSYLPNVFAEIDLDTKISYALIWLPAAFSAYYNLKHVLIPDMGFGFVRAIRPFNVCSLIYIATNLLHYTVWNYFGWTAILLTGILQGLSIFALIITAKYGVEKWTI